MSRPDGHDYMKGGLADRSEDFLRNNLATSMEHFEVRDSQLIMMNTCAENIEGGGVIAAEAGTGTGKTFAYLVPIILSGKKAIISTKTLNLQEQLASKDLGFLSSLTEFTFAKAKGRGNYLCLRRLNSFRSD